MSEHAQPGAGQIVLGLVTTAPENAAERLAHVYRISDPRLSELPLDALLDELLVRVREILEVDTAAILLLDEGTGELVARAAKGLEEEVERGVRIPLGKGFAGRVAAQRVPIFIRDVAHADILNPVLREAGVRSLLGVPLIVEGALTGVLHVGTLAPRDFGDVDAALLQLAAARAAPAIERARLFQALEREHRTGVLLQRSLLPARLPDIPGVTVAARYLPARDEVGGDWYDVVELGRGRVGIAIGDVAGHGVRAAALMGQLRIGLRAYAIDGHAPAVVLGRLDRLLDSLDERGMATVAYAVHDPDSDLLRISIAGHPPPLAIAADGTVRRLDLAPAPPLGSISFVQYRDHEVSFAEGETLLLYTDGLVERPGEALDEGLGRLAEATAEAGREGRVEELVAGVIQRMVPEEGARDDVALVALRRDPVRDVLRLELPADPQPLSHTRQALRRWLRKAGADERETADILVACGEACANAVEHAYGPGRARYQLEARHTGGVVTLTVRDRGSWRPPRADGRGRGLQLMREFMDDVRVERGDAGTTVTLIRRLGGRAA